MKKRYEFLNLLRLFAILMVINSHCDLLYPIPALATGGAVGNSLFFVISGFLLKQEGGFGSFIKKRFVRLYPAAFLIVTLDLLLGRIHIHSFGDVLTSYIWPTPFWFISAILLFDICLYWLNRLGVMKRFGLFSLAMLVLYFTAYFLVIDRTQWSVEEPGLLTAGQCFKLIYYFYIYAMGYYLKNHTKQTFIQSKKTLVILALVCFAASFGVKAVFVKWPAAYSIQFITQFINIAFAYFAMRLLFAYEESYCARVPAKVRGFIAYFASKSLEIYVVQFDVIHYCAALPFPVNMGVAIVAIFLLAIPLQKIDQWLARVCLSAPPQK